MLDRNKQTKALQPQEVFSDWLEGLKRLGGGAVPQNWQESIDFIERQINGALEAQIKSMKTLIANTESVTDVPESFAQWFARLEQSIELCGEMQQRLWEVWFNMLRSTTGPGTGTTVYENWQEMMDHAVSMQEQMFNQWMTLQPAPEQAPRSKRAKSYAPGKSTGAVRRKKTASK